MWLAGTAFYKIVQMFCILLLGCALYKLDIIDTPANRRLSNLLLMVITPMLIFTSYQMDMTLDLIRGWLETFLLSSVSFALIIITVRFLPKSKQRDLTVEQVAIVYSNCGYIGLPLLNVLFGSEGVFYMTVHMTMFNILVWLHGATVLSGQASLKELLSNLKKPMILAVVAGVICFFCRITVPRIIEEPLEMLADMNTPLAMLVAGISIADTNISEMLRDARIYLISFLKLIAYPLLFLLVVRWFSWDELPLITVFIAVACPVGTTATQLALRYGRDDTYATQLLAVSTIFSIVSIPAMLIVFNTIG